MSLKEIRKICIKKSECLFAYSYRYISTMITSFLIKTKITPNQVTIMSLLSGIFAAISFSLGQYNFTILGAILLQISLILDHVDGDIARYKNLKSAFGDWLDTLSDYIKLFLICVGISIGSFIQSNNLSTLILGLLSLSILASVGIALTSLGSKDKKTGESKSFKISKRIHIGLNAPTVLLFTIGPLIKQVNLMFIIYLIIGSLALIKLFISRYKLLKNMNY